MITIKIDKEETLNKVHLVTHYTGAKMADDGSAFRRIATTEEDETKLVRLMNDSLEDVVNMMRSLSPAPASTDEGITITIVKMPANYDTSLTTSMIEAVKQFFVNNIVAQWFLYTDKQESQVFAAMAADNLKKAHTMLFTRLRPVRTI